MPDYSQRFSKKVLDIRKISSQVAREVVRREDRKTSEIKHYDYGYLPTVSYAGDIQALTPVTQGDTDVTRDGDRLMPIKLSVKWLINGETYSGLIRVIIFRWNDFSIPTVDDILQSTGSSYSVVSPYVRDKKSNFQVLQDRVYSVSNNGGVEVRTGSYTSKKLAKKQIEYVGGTATSAKNSFYSLILSDRVLASSPTMTAFTSLQYTDH